MRIYIYREREIDRERERCLYVDIYIYIHREREWFRVLRFRASTASWWATGVNMVNAIVVIRVMRIRSMIKERKNKPKNITNTLTNNIIIMISSSSSSSGSNENSVDNKVGAADRVWIYYIYTN